MPFLVWNNEGIGGYWGNGATEEEATANWRANGGRGERLVMKVADGYVDPFVDMMGNPRGYPTDEVNALEPEDWPRFDERVWRVTARGKRTEVSV